MLLIMQGCKEQSKTDEPQAPPEVGVYQVISQPVTLVTELPGRVSAYRVSEVRPQVNGIILKRLFTEGSNVTEGQQLYQIDDSTYLADYYKADANLMNAERLMKRYKKLKESGALSQQDYDNSYYAWKQAKANKELMQITLAYTKVRAPISGRIGRSNVTEGALVQNGQPQAIAMIQQTDPVYIDVTRPMTQILSLDSQLESGGLSKDTAHQTQVKLKLGDDGSIYPLTGTLKFSELSVDQTTGAITIRAEFPNPDGKLHPGMFVHAQLVEGIVTDGILLPQQAITFNTQGQPTTWVVKDDSHVELRMLETERTIGNTWLIRSGIKVGEHVVTEGVQRVSAGSIVKPVPAKNVHIKTNFSSPISNTRD